MPLGMEVGLNPGDFVLYGDPAPSPKRGQSPQFSAHAYCGQTAGWIKMPLGTDVNLDMEVGLSPGDFVLDGDPAPLPKKGAEPPIFGPCLLWPNGWMDRGATWYRGKPRPRRRCVRWDRSSHPSKGHNPHSFQFMSIVAFTTGWMKAPAGTEVDLGPRHIVLDGDPAPPGNGQQPPSFQSMSIVATVARLSYC